jgi:alcohol dehydrogenase class IV
MHFDFATAGRIVFGAGVASGIGKIASEFGSRAFVVMRRRAGFVPLENSGIECVRYAVSGEPTVDDARSGAEAARSAGCHVVIAVGGGSVIDVGKAIAALAPNSGEPLDYLEVIGEGKPLENAPLPFIAIPTTAGTGSEVTRNAVLGSRQHGVKASLRSPLMLPRVAMVDPDLTLDLPADVTASTGLDALTQLIEPYVSVRANPMTDVFCLEGLPRVRRSLEAAFVDGSDRHARSDMSWASLLGGLALANAGLGIVHGFAAPVGGMFDAPHGAICAALLPYAMRTNVRALRSRNPNGMALERYRRLAAILICDERVEAEDGVDWIAGLCSRLRIKPLSAYGVSDEHLGPLIEKALRASSTKSNPIELNPAEMRAIIEPAL